MSKKFLIATLCIICILSFALIKYGHTVGDTLGVTGTVNSNNALDVKRSGSDFTTYPFGSVEVGSETVPGTAFVLVVSSNTGSAWSVQMSAAEMEIGATGVTIDQTATSGLHYWHTFDQPHGTETPTTGSAQVPESASTIFASGTGYDNVDDVEVSLDLKLIVPATQQGGDYATTITFTLVN